MSRTIFLERVKLMWQRLKREKKNRFPDFFLLALSHSILQLFCGLVSSIFYNPIDHKIQPNTSYFHVQFNEIYGLIYFSKHFCLVYHLDKIQSDLVNVFTALVKSFLLGEIRPNQIWFSWKSSIFSSLH